MVRDPQSGAETPALQSVLDALDDADCRTIVKHLDEPMTANEISDVCDIPMSTTYRKLDLLTEASLLAESTEIRADGHHTTRYRIDFEAVEIGLDEDRTLEISVARPAQSADERLASLWSEVREET
ncbi:Helix-turn-helix domain-containing protein [Haloplanus vescus]|uniref:Helix-turn-helix domain-containing protein n=1 Tax=Haloplanus vescus TaxID=555874 RepID=A0A1H3VMG1_9EURY|nr:transcriptional regulator [Haloplanus vescus]SDZ75891.1 Helix-turn-helix domain-containing protein [Haloplanus vescus]